MQPQYPYCNGAGKVSYPTPAKGYLDLEKRGRRSYSRKSTGHYKCKNCGGYHMVTVNNKPKGNRNGY